MDIFILDLIIATLDGAQQILYSLVVVLCVDNDTRSLREGIGAAPSCCHFLDSSCKEQTFELTSCHFTIMEFVYCFENLLIRDPSL